MKDAPIRPADETNGREGHGMNKVTAGMLAFVISVLVSCGGPSSGVTIVESRQLEDGYWLAKTTSLRFCIANENRPSLLCESTEHATHIGWHDRFIGVRINVPSKEYLLIDTSDGYIWVLGEAEFSEAPEAQRLTMMSVEDAWRQLGRHGVT